MALHRDIHWVGKQWAVTGFGLQLIDQKRKGEFDLEPSHLWENGLLERMRAKAWLNSDDFAKGLSIARARYPRPPGEKEPPDTKASDVSRPVEPAQPVQTVKSPIEFSMKIRGVRAKFLRPWRIRPPK